jgi:16S rRNA (adenine1518-N6/adenine1519-N6)-dimethyltransferase
VGRRLGQHFLVRHSILEKIAVAACPETVPLVVEIGPGRGALTQHLVHRSEQVVAIEVDPVLAQYLRQKFRSTNALTVIEQDVLKVDLGQWGPAVIAGNLPYYITSPVLTRVFATPEWRAAVFLVQREVAERITAQPGSRDYGFLTVHTALHARPELLFTVSPSAFRPVPKVESAVIRLAPRDARSELGIQDIDAFVSFARLAFAQKRKTLRNNLRARYPAIEDSSEASMRAEQLSLSDLAALYRRLTGVTKSGNKGDEMRTD